MFHAMKAVIIDDEAPVRNTITALLKKSFPDITISAAAGSVAEGIAVVTEHQPDILFLDIELPDGILYTIDVRVQVVEENGEFTVPVPIGPGTVNSHSLRSVA